MTWNIRDPLLEDGLPGSGLAAYSVQVCLDNQPCQNLISNPGLSGTHFFEGNPDHTYTLRHSQGRLFRVWAKDRVDNETTEASVQNTASVTKYYLFGGQPFDFAQDKRVAMRQGDAVYYLHGDHPSPTLRKFLGSVSMSTDASGNLVSQARHTPFGEVHWESGPAVTDFGFTGQRREGCGLMDYNARFYELQSKYFQLGIRHRWSQGRGARDVKRKHPMPYR